MTEINKPDMKITPHVANKNVQPDVKIEKLNTEDITKDYKEAIAPKGADSSYRVFLNGVNKTQKADNIENDIQKILDNPKLLDKSEVLFNAAEKAGVSYPEAAAFATSELS